MKKQSRFDRVVENFKNKFPGLTQKGAESIARAYISKLGKIAKNQKGVKQ